ncbi:PAS domain S-box protein [Novosphingobium sp. P6W]|uniref:PAS domain S-box protein n=1 Tax=Novosphingobium sp. P6W TaxID=1609758 RepID=UPI0009E31A69|nr:PAS domain S-box protein [Novosphingobium sp. P6W]AXB77120.1 PAS domain S-box protein [Novosphingobium sp. P6W]
MTHAELEEENARLRAALAQAGIFAQRLVHLQTEKTSDQGLGKFASAQDLVAELESHRQALASSEARQRAIFENATDFAMVITDPNGIVTDWNPGAEQVIGWTSKEMIGQDANCFFTPEDRAIGRITVEMDQALRDGRASDERWHLRKSGERFWASGEMVPLIAGNEGHLGFVKILRDRTEEHLAGGALRKAQERFQTIIETIDAAFAIVQVKFDEDDRPIDYRFVEANPAFERQSGVNLRGKWVTEFAPDLEPFWFEIYGHVAKTGEPTNFENYAEAFKRWFDVRTVRVGDPADRQIAILFNDVTERRGAQERLRASEALARENAERVQLALGAGAIIGTWHWDLPSDQFTFDEPFAAAFGLDPALGRSGIPLAQIVATVHPDDQQGLSDAINEVVARGGHYAHQYRVRRTDGRYYWIEANGRVDHAPDGTPLSFPGVVIDVEARRAVEAERDRALAALRSLNENLEQRVAERTAELMDAEEKLRQSQKMEAVGQLTGGLAHDFNNLLAGISGSLELMGKRIDQGRLTEIDKYMAAAQGASRRAAALTHRLLAFSRRQTLDPRSTNVEALVDGMIDLIQRTVGPEIHIETRATAQLCSALVDASQLENALLNLCINARDAMPGGGRIAIEMTNQSLDRQTALAYEIPAGDYLSLSVSDTGTGMPPDVIARVFEPFYTTKPIGQGTGLGLSMIYGFVQQSGGQIRIHSSVGQGTTVRLYLPRHDGDAISGEQVMPEAPVDIGRAEETVLVVDDEPTVRLLVADTLRDLGYTVIEAVDGNAGLQILRSNTGLDLLITDVGLPGGLNGRQMADAGRLLRPDLKTLFITGYAENAVFGEGRLEANMQILTKPFAVDVLAVRIREMLRTD